MLWLTVTQFLHLRHICQMSRASKIAMAFSTATKLDLESISLMSKQLHAYLYVNPKNIFTR